MGTSLFKEVVFFNGATGGLGRFFAAQASAAGLLPFSVATRLESAHQLAKELDAHLDTLGSPHPARVTWVQLAAMVSVPGCEKEPEKAFKTNVQDTTSTISAFANWCEKHRIAGRVLYVSSGHVYAEKPWGRRISETDAVAPRSVYAKSKLQAEQELLGLSKERDLPFVVSRVFGLLAPGQPPHYVLPGLIRRAQEGRFGDIPGLDYARDYLDARDVCRGLSRLAAMWNWPSTSTVNLCSGKPTKIRDLMKLVLDLTKKECPSLQGAAGRPDDVPWIVGDPTHLADLLGRPIQTLSLKKTIHDAIAFED